MTTTDSKPRRVGFFNFGDDVAARFADADQDPASQLEVHRAIVAETADELESSRMLVRIIGIGAIAIALFATLSARARTE